MFICTSGTSNEMRSLPVERNVTIYEVNNDSNRPDLAVHLDAARQCVAASG